MPAPAEFARVAGIAAFLAATGCGLEGCSTSPAPRGDTTAGDGCTWQQLASGPVQLRARSCRYATGHWRVQAEPDLPGFALWRDNERVATVIQWFPRLPDAPVDAILPALRSRGYIPNDAECVFRPATGPAAPRTRAYHDIRPVGARLARLEATPADQIPDPPCGDYGWSTHGVRYFLTDLRFPEWVLYVNEGQDGTLIDAGSIAPR
ncbi:MAG: hypothetical protein WCJ69_17545 [Betaproteobacteria bacterium]|jgi:hypothetical protein